MKIKLTSGIASPPVILVLLNTKYNPESGLTLIALKGE
jgi:hypothetical protein